MTIKNMKRNALSKEETLQKEQEVKKSGKKHMNNINI